MLCSNESPDAHIEEFWLGLKSSMINFYKWSSQISRPIDAWSQRLNFLQSQKKYDQIERCILNYLSSYSLDMMRYGNRYHADILETNIRRWNRLSLLYNFHFKNETNHVLTLFEIFVKNMERDNPDFNNEFLLMFQQVELFLFTDDYYPLIELAIKHKYTSILDSLRSQIDISEIINSNLSLSIPLPKNISGKKIIDILNCV